MMGEVVARQTVAGEIFTRLAALDFGDAEEALRILFRLRSLDSGTPDALVKTCRADAALIAGFRDEADDAAAIAFSLRSQLELPALSRLLLVLLFLGERVRTLVVAKELLDVPGVIADEDTVTNLVTAVTWAGDVFLLSRLAEIAEKAGVRTTAADFLSFLRRSEFVDLFPGHQLAVIEAMRGCQMFATTQMCENDTSDFVVINNTMVDGTRCDRRTIEERLEAALDLYYSGKDVSESLWRGLIMTIVGEAPRHIGAEMAGPAAA